MSKLTVTTRSVDLRPDDAWSQMQFADALLNEGRLHEALTAYEFGYRNYMLGNVTFDLSLFYNDYKDLLALSLALPSTLDN